MPRKIHVLPLICAIFLAACAPTLATRGNYLDDEMLKNIQIGVSSKAEVEQRLGTPTTTDPFDPNLWFYIGEKTETEAFFNPEVQSRKVVVLRFNNEGLLADARQYDEKDGTRVETVKKKTPAPGKEMNAFEQFISNLGKFNKSEVGDNRPAQGR